VFISGSPSTLSSDRSGTSWCRSEPPAACGQAIGPRNGIPRCLAPNSDRIRLRGNGPQHPAPTRVGRRHARSHCRLCQTVPQRRVHPIRIDVAGRAKPHSTSHQR
jgi:hypothetical protein